MLTITLVVIGKIKESYIRQGIEIFIKWLRPYCRLEVIELPAAPMFKKIDSFLIEEAKLKEGERILQTLNPQSYKIVLDLQGTMMTSEALAKKLGELMVQGSSQLTFIIGGAFGLAPSVMKEANLLLSLSKFTFTHEMARLIVCEQIYRSYKILNGEPYHY